MPVGLSAWISLAGSGVSLVIVGRSNSSRARLMRIVWVRLGCGRLTRPLRVSEVWELRRLACRPIWRPSWGAASTPRSVP